MSLILEKLREQLGCLEERQRRFSHTISIADAIDNWMPYGGLPAGCIHEVKGATLAAAMAFSTVLATRLNSGNNIVFVAPDRSLNPLGLLTYGLNLDQMLMVSTRRPKDIAWAVMEALRCSQVCAVIALLDGLDLTASRRLQLAAENSGVTGFFLGNTASAPVAAPITRWKISPLLGKPGQRFDEPTWNLDLLYCRGGRPGTWSIEWKNQQLAAAVSSAFSVQPFQATA